MVLMKLGFKSKMAEIEKNSEAQGFMFKLYDEIKVTMGNLLTKNMNSPTKRLKMLKN